MIGPGAGRAVEGKQRGARCSVQLPSPFPGEPCGLLPPASCSGFGGPGPSLAPGSCGRSSVCTCWRRALDAPRMLLAPWRERFPLTPALGAVCSHPSPVSVWLPSSPEMGVRGAWAEELPGGEFSKHATSSVGRPFWLCSLANSTCCGKGQQRWKQANRQTTTKTRIDHLHRELQFLAVQAFLSIFCFCCFLFCFACAVFKNQNNKFLIFGLKPKLLLLGIIN